MIIYNGLFIYTKPSIGQRFPVPVTLRNVAEVFYGNPLTPTFVYTTSSIGQSMPLIGAQYRVVQPHWINNVRYEVGTIIRETDVMSGPGELPIGWVPTLAVDPLNSFAVTAFYNAGPRGIAYEDLNRWANSQWDNIAPSTTVVPVTFWVKRGKQYFLTGLGSGFPPISVPFGG